MKIVRTIILGLFLFLISACTNSINETWLIPVDSHEVITTKQLLENGYEWVSGVDVPLYEKVNTDTLYGYQFSTDESGVVFQYWRVLKSLNSPKEVKAFLAINNLYTVAEYDSSSRFVVVNGSNNALLVCTLTKENYLNLVYYHLSSD
jgi:hypothetical protein